MDNNTIQTTIPQNNTLETAQVTNYPETPQPNIPAKPQPITSPKDNKNTIIMILGIVALTFACLALFFGVIAFTPNRQCQDGDSGSSSNNSGQTNTTPDDDYSTPVDINKVEGYKDVYDMLEVLAMNVGKNSSAITTNSNIEIYYVPEGLNTHVNLRLSLIRTIDADLERAKNNFISQNFDLVGEMPQPGTAPAPTTYEYLNKEKNIVCGVYPIINEDTGKETVHVSCAKTSWTWLTEEEKKTLSEFETAYHEKTGEYPEKMNSLSIKTKESRFKPYQTATISTTGISSFYRTSPDSEWQYFRTAMSSASCDEYNTEDLKKAYLGEICYNSTGETTVQF